MTVAADRPAGYSAVQIALHWIIAVLILLQFLAHDGIEHAWDAFEDGEAVAGGDLPLAYLHVSVGVAILLLAVVRVWIRLTRGAPPLPENDPAIARFGAHAVHGLIYVLLFLTPLSGAAAWFLGVEEAGDAHEALKSALLILIVLHIAGAIFQQFVMRSGVLMRMFRPAA